MHDLGRADRSILLQVLAELHDAVVEAYPAVAAWARHVMFPLADDSDQFEVIADVEFDEYERSGEVDPLASLSSDELAFLRSHLAQEAAHPEGLPAVVREALAGWIGELGQEQAARRTKA